MNRKNWIPAWFLFAEISLGIHMISYFTNMFSWSSYLFCTFIAFFESYMWEIVHHRGFTHGAYEFTHPFWTQLFRVIHTPTYPEEIYDISHRCHHVFSDKLGDPYTPKGGLLYITSTEINHQLLARDMSREDYDKVKKILSKYVLFLNSYEGYKKWGTAAIPWLWIIKSVLVFEIKAYIIYYLLGLPMAFAYAVGVGFNAIGFKVANYFIHGYGKDRRRPGKEFNENDWAYNHWFGILTIGQWHANHHLYPQSANTGIAPGQIDIPFLIIKGLEKLHIVKNVKNYRPDFMTRYYLPWKKSNLSDSASKSSL